MKLDAYEHFKIGDKVRFNTAGRHALRTNIYLNTPGTVVYVSLSDPSRIKVRFEGSFVRNPEERSAVFFERDYSK